MKAPHVLMIVDGFGLRDETEGNAIATARTPFFDEVWRDYPHVGISASGEAVGLMPGLMGNSEVGHMNIGAGRVVVQDIDRINNAIADGSFYENAAFNEAAEAALTRGTRLHLMGLVSDGGVHSSDQHYFALLELCRRRGLTGDRVVFHAFLDGRDTPPRSAEKYLAALEVKMAEAGTGVLATVVGRYYAMDRDKRWDRVKRAYDALVRGVAEEEVDSAKEALAHAYEAGENDEFVKPRILRGTPRIGKGDAVITFNYRSDRMRELTEAFVLPDFGGFEVEKGLNLTYVTMTRYKKGYPVPVAFAPVPLDMVFGELAEKVGLRQLRIAETEKYAHVTFFFNGGREEPFEGEDRIIVPSPKVATYDLQPEMSAPEVTEKVVDDLEHRRHDVIIMNFANPDMVGHTGFFDAAVKAVEAVDRGAMAIKEAVLSLGGSMLFTADHGNVEMMFDPATGQPHTAHTTNLVPLVAIDPALRGRTLRSGGRLADVIPTFLEMIGVDQPPQMTGHSLLE
ncbi:MAG TPA: 2,3-bisphosphoglycerate-independent phosphoglycerate mutase [Planctomycetes bacterium]|nr:2,3-bisphosphoglycerate-independent phosphoglycerate mutase [Planctomycetota bacterium]